MTVEIFTSKQLGIIYPYIPRIAVGGCGSDDPIHTMRDSSENYLAHAHVCDNDPDKGMICFEDKRDIFDSRISGNKLSHTFWHEYAHILVGGQEFDCPDDKDDFTYNFTTLQRQGHGPKWKETMMALDQYVPYTYYSNEELWDEVEAIKEFS